jgi:hypothetical protein
VASTILKLKIKERHGAEGFRSLKRKGLSFVSEVKKAFPMSEKDSVGMEVGLQSLEKIYPGFAEWSKNLKKILVKYVATQATRRHIQAEREQCNSRPQD